MKENLKLSEKEKEQLNDPKGMVGDNGPDFVLNRLVEETLVGMHGTGRERMMALGSYYESVQAEVNRRLKAK